MKYEIENEKIRDILNELGEEYKDSLIECTLSQNHEYDIDRINISTLIKLDERIKDSLLVNKKVSKRNRLLSMLSILGLVYTLFGLILLVFFQLGDSLRYDPISTASLLIILIGLSSSLIASLVRNMPVSSHYKTEDTSKYFNYKIINTWKQIEGLLVQLTPAEENMSMNLMISNLMDLKLLSSGDAITIKKLLNLRNQVVHSNKIEKSYTTREIQILLNDSNNIIKKLQKFESG